MLPPCRPEGTRKQRLPAGRELVGHGHAQGLQALSHLVQSRLQVLVVVGRHHPGLIWGELHLLGQPEVRQRREQHLRTSRSTCIGRLGRQSSMSADEAAAQAPLSQLP